ncbi:MAG: substrate-binding domain-containing protein, partial [Planctomycetota bacterium]
GKVAIFVGRVEQDNGRRRRQGTIDGLLDRPRNPDGFYSMNEVIKEDGYEIIGTFTDNTEKPKAKNNAEDVLSKYPDVAAMVGLFAYNPPLILEALKQAGKAGEVVVVGFDEEDGTLRGIQDGEIVGTVVQNPFEYGRQSVRVLAGLSRGKSLQDLGIDESGVMMIPAREINRENVDDFWAELKKNTAASE